jgi:hypothetical protein
VPTEPTRLLDYHLATHPSPLRVSSPGEESPAVVDIAVSAPAGRSVYCRQIIIAVPVGPGAGDLGEAHGALTPNTTRWTVSDSAVLPDPAFRYARYTARCTSPQHWLIDYDLRFRLVAPAVNQAEGTIGIVVAEISDTDPRPSTLRRTVLDLDKAPVEGYLRNLVTTATQPSAVSVPCSAFAAGHPVRVAWESNAESFDLYLGAGTSPAWSGEDTSTVLTTGFTADSTITVVSRGAHGGRTATTAVTITDPTLTPASLTTPSLTTGTFTTAGAVAVSGALTAAEAFVTRRLSAPGADFGAATVDRLAVSGQVTMLGAARSLAAGTYRAEGDGFAIGTVDSPSSPTRCSTIAYGWTATTGYCYATGGCTEFFWDSGRWTLGAIKGSFVVPVAHGDTYVLGSFDLGGGVSAPVTYRWMPLGKASRPNVAAVAAPFAAPSLAAALADLVGDRLTPAQRTRLDRAVRVLAATRPPLTPGATP